MHVRFLGSYDYTPSDAPRVLVAYKAGWQGSVRRECGDAAIRAGKAERVKAPRRGEAAAPAAADAAAQD